MCLGLLAGPVFAGPSPPAPSQWVTDSTRSLTPELIARLNTRLRSYQEQTGHQILVWIGKTPGDVPIDDWAAKTFKDWRVGRKGFDDGLILFVMSEDRSARIEVGYGLEGQIPDAIASRILNESLIPKIKAGDLGSGVDAAVSQLLKTIGGEGTGVAPPPATSFSPLEIILLVIAGLSLLILSIRYPIFGSYLLMILSSILRRGRGGGSSAEGGGGRSGGGGASGKW